MTRNELLEKEQKAITELNTKQNHANTSDQLLKH